MSWGGLIGHDRAVLAAVRMFYIEGGVLGIANGFPSGAKAHF